MGRDNTGNENERKVLNDLPNKVIIRKNENCKYSKICPFKNGCLGAIKNSEIRNEIFICDLKTLKENYKKLIMI